MIFTLEALEAKQGDALILHHGDKASPRFFCIDGGPAKVYKSSLKPRLEALRQKFSKDDGKLDIEMIMVSHIDDDHIHGILDWMGELDEGNLQDNISRIWFNSFDDVLGNVAEELPEHAKTAATGGSLSGHSAAVVASVGQGRDLRDVAEKLGIHFNSGFDGLVIAGSNGATVRDMEDGLQFTVLGPARKQLEALSKEWEKDVKAHPPAQIAAFVDKSVPNLSSIVVLAEAGGKSILLTGDARGDLILDGLATAGRLKEGKIHVDVMKVPHHGSIRDVAPEFFERITADHYVISANGLFDNPDVATLQLLTTARGAGKYTIHLTNHDMKNKDGVDIGANIRAFFDSSATAAPGRKVVYRDAASLSMKVDLLEPVTY